MNGKTALAGDFTEVFERRDMAGEEKRGCFSEAA